jgi:hypothetical protein
LGVRFYVQRAVEIACVQVGEESAEIGKNFLHNFLSQKSDKEQVFCFCHLFFLVAFEQSLQ